MNLIFIKKGFKSIYQKINSTMVEYHYREVENDWVAFFPKKDEKVTPIYQSPYKNESKQKDSIFSFLFFLTVQQFSIVNIIFYHNEYDSIPINIINILFALSSDFTMNAILFSDDIISQRYHNGGELNYSTTIMLTVLSNVLSYIISMIPAKLTNFSNCLEIYTKEGTKNDLKYLRKLNSIMNIIKIKLYIFFGYVYFLQLVYLYFLCAFCSVYHGSQLSWFKDGFISIGIPCLTAIGMSIIVAIIRYIGLKCKSKMIFNFSLYLQK